MYHFLQKLISSLRPSSTNANLLQRVPPFVFYLFYVTYKTGRLQRVPPFNIFSTLCEFFFRKFSIFQKSPPSEFLIFCNRKYVNESQRVPPFHFSALCDVFEVFFKNFFQKNFQKNFQKFLFPVEKSDFPVISSMKGTLGCLESVFKAFHEYILGIFRKLSFLSLRYSADFRRSRLVHLNQNIGNFPRVKELLYYFENSWVQKFF